MLSSSGSFYSISLGAPTSAGQICLTVPSMARGVAQLFNQAMEANEVELLAPLLALAGDINSKKIIKWFSPAHEIAIGMWRHGIRESGRYLITHGLDLHVVADNDFRSSVQYNSYANDTPTAFVMRYSHSFFLFRKLLRDLNIDMKKFVEDELKQWPLTKAGWTQETLLSLFELGYTPLKMPAINCQTCN